MSIKITIEKEELIEMIDEKSVELKKKVESLSNEEYDRLVERIGDALWTEFSNFTDDYVDGSLSALDYNRILTNMIAKKESSFVEKCQELIKGHENEFLRDTIFRSEDDEDEANDFDG